MKLLLILSLLLAFNTYASDMQQYLQDTETLVCDKKYEEALERTIWFHNNALKYDSAISGVRLSFALSEWHEFGKKYPPALAALKDIRDNKTKSIIAGNVSFELFHDIESINDELSEKEKTLALFYKIDKMYPIFAKDAWILVKDDVIKSNNQTLIKKYLQNILSEYTKIRNRHIDDMSWYHSKKMDKKNNDELVTWLKNNFVEESIQLIELAIETNDKETAETIKTDAYGIQKDKRISEISIN